MPFATQGGGGGGAGGSGNASVGVLLRQSGENDKGLFLTARRADLTWHGRGESVGDTDPAIGSHVDLPNNGGGPGVNRHAYLRLRFPADIMGYAGAASNNIVVRLNRLDAVAASPVVVWTAGTLTITVGASTSFSTVADAIAAFTTFTITTSQSDNAVGTDVFLLGADATGTNYNAMGGRDEIEPGIELLAQPEDAVNGPNILAKYDPDNHTLQDILDELEENDQGVTITVPYGTDLSASPEAVPWMRGFDAGIGPTEAPTTGTGGLTQGQVDARVRALAKGYALRGGPMVPDSEIPDQEARDAEVPSLLEAALTERTPSTGFDDQIVFLTAADEWSKADSQAWRQRLSVDVGAWSDTPGFYVFRPGDYTTSNGQLYRVNAQTTKDLSNGPETNAAFTLIGLFAGNWSDHWFKSGSIVRHSSALWMANADISRGDGAPGSNADWHRISEDPATVVGVAQNASSPLTFTLTRADGATYDITVAGAADSVIGFDVTGATLQVNKRDGTHEQHTLPSGGTHVVANPTGTGGDILERLTVGTQDFQIPQATADTLTVHWEETSVVASSQQGGRQWALGNGATGGLWRVPFDCEVVSLSFIYAMEPITQTTGFMELGADHVVGFEKVDDFDGELELATTDAVKSYGNVTAIPDLEVTLPMDDSEDQWGFSAAFVPEADAPISLSVGDIIRPVTTAPDNTTSVVPTGGTVVAATLMLTLRRTGAAAQPATTVRPHVSSFRSTSGNLSPVAGSIAAQVYGVEWGIAQSDHVGAARILGFKGDFDPNSVNVLHTIDAGSIAHGSASLTIPNGITLAADEEYHLRIQVFDEGVTNPAAGTAPASYQDVLIRAHAAATALYHWGRVTRVANQDAATYAAAIVFATDDLVTGATLDTVNGYDATPDTTGNWIFYLAAQEDETQPTGWTSDGFPANAVFQDAEDQDYNSVSYKVYVMRDSFYRTNDDGSVNYKPTA